MADEIENYGDSTSDNAGEVGTTSFNAEATEKTQPTPERAKLVKETIADIKARKKHFEKAFKRMKADMEFAKRGADKTWPDGNYIVNIAQRHVQQRVSSLYAKNPTAVAKRRKTVDYKVWDGNAQSLQQAQQIMTMLQSPEAMAMAAANPEAAMQMMPQVQQAMALIQDVQESQQRIMMLNKLGQTLEALFHYYTHEGTPNFKLQMKQLVRRVVTCGVGYVELGFQRIMDQSSTLQNQIADLRDEIAHAERLANELAEKKMDPDAAGVEKLRLQMQALMEKKDVLIREGLVFDFPRATSIIPDQHTECIKGWVGTRRLAREFLFSPERIRELWGVDVGTNYTAYTKNGNQAKGKKGDCLVWIEYEKDSGLMYTVCDGYPDFLQEPAAPPIELEQFFPIFALSFNDLETDECDEYGPFPPSDVSLIKHQAMEINRAREGLRQHRKANAPKYATAKGRMDNEDKDKLRGAVAHEVVELNSLNPNESVDALLQPIKHAGIDPALYDVNPQMDDILRSVGSQEANLGPTSGATATESSIAEGSRLATQASAIDDVDDLLTAVARSSSQVMLRELNQETVTKIAGPGAVWPQMSEQEIVDELWLEIAAGSSGRPNKAQELQNLERVVPLLVQIPGVSPDWLAKEMVRRLDDHVDIAEAIISGLPSITAMNGMANSANPQDQGPEGANNSPRPDEGRRGSDAGGQRGAMRQEGVPA